MKFENMDVWGFEHALRGMRNPKNSWDKNDSHYVLKGVSLTKNFTPEFVIGPNDLKLARSLIKAGSEHRKFLRQIFVSVDLTAPLYFWKEFDTYKVATVANSCSTMHKILSEPITEEMFEDCDYEGKLEIVTGTRVDDFRTNLINILEGLRWKAIKCDKNGDKELSKKYWKELIRWLPEGWLQKRTVTLNYETLYCIINQRKNHKLIEWHKFIEWAKELPNMKILFDFDDEVDVTEIKKDFIPCDAYHVDNYVNYDVFTGETTAEKRAICYGVKEIDECSCGGDKRKCNFYAYDEVTGELK